MFASKSIVPRRDGIKRSRSIRFIFAFLFILSLFPSSPVRADDPGSSVFPELKIGVGARPAAMGNAYTGASGDIYSMHWNPAGLAPMKASELSMSRTMLFADIDLTQGSFAMPAGPFVIGGSFNYVDYGGAGERLEISGVNPQTAAGGNGILEPHAYIASLALARQFNPRLALGGTLKVFQVDLVDQSATAVAVDLGATYEVMTQLQLGAAVKNLGTGIKFQLEDEDLPLLVTLGARYKVDVLPLTLYSDVDFPTDNDVSAKVGGEYYVMDKVALRVGYSSDFDAGSGLTAGVGVEYRDWRFDYAFQATDGAFDNIHKMTLSKLFGGANYEDLRRDMARSSLERGSRPDRRLALVIDPNRKRILKSTTGHSRGTSRSSDRRSPL